MGGSSLFTEIESSMNLSLLPLTSAGDAPGGAEEVLSPGKRFDRLARVLRGRGWPLSSDGRKVPYAGDLEGHSQLFELDLGTQRTRQSRSHQMTINADVSPDGRWLVYVSDSNGSGQLWRMPADGGQAQALTQGDDRVRRMFFSQDSRWSISSRTT